MRRRYWILWIALCTAISVLYLYLISETFISIDKERMCVLSSNVLLPANGSRILYLTPCNGTLSRGFVLEFKIKASKPINIIIVDEEQFIELYGRDDLYGYMVYEHRVEELLKRVYYPPGMPCWKIYIVINGMKGTEVHVEVYVYSR